MIDWKQMHRDAFTGTRVLVTGAAGFIGSHLVEALVALGAEVVGLDDLSGGSWDVLAGFGRPVRQITGSILDEAALIDAMSGCRYVFHQAALASVPQSVAEPVRFYDINLTGTLRVMEAARRAGVSRVMFAGSSSAYGDPPGEPAPRREDAPPFPLSPYASSKTACEQLLYAWSQSYGVDTAVFRYFNVFGPRQNANSAYAAVIAAFATALAAGRQPLIFGDGNQTRDFVAVYNVVHANLLAARHPGPLRGEIFNVGSGRTITVNELYQSIAAAMGRADVHAEHRPPRAGDVLHSSADISKARRMLGYEPVAPFEAALRETVAWYAGQTA
jgi:nucleoside-diphosphate-sugar epimerase